MERLSRARLGPIPLPYILIIVLLPLWIFFSIGDNPLLYSVCTIITILLKGSLLSRWFMYRHALSRPWPLAVSAVILLEIYMMSEDLRMSIISLVLLVPVSTMTGISLVLLHPDSQGEGKRTVIGIFSRSSPDEYNWLSDTLRSAGKVVPFVITNNNFREFRNQVSQCTFTILYHSKTRGRVNITNVTDSLYDSEVQHMSETLGRGKVLVVVDDLEDSSDRAKHSILQNQDLIRDQTWDVYLFTREEKRGQERARQKLQPFLNILSQGSYSNVIADVVGAFILCAPWLHYCIGGYHGSVLILSNINGSLLLYNFLLPFSQSGTVLPLTYPIHRPKRAPWGTKKGSLKAGLPALFLVTGLEFFAVYFYNSGMKVVLLYVQSFCTVLYALLSPSLSSTPSSAAP